VVPREADDKKNESDRRLDLDRPGARRPKTRTATLKLKLEGEKLHRLHEPTGTTAKPAIEDATIKRVKIISFNGHPVKGRTGTR
jgi:hypothetical protein